jgi:CRP/FNR family transcriptional regulator, cyclic AMP receptor protein
MDPSAVQSIPLFAGLSKDDQKVVAQYADEVDVEPGTVLAQEGRLAYEFFAIEEGTADVTLGGKHAATLGPGDFFGEIALVSHAPRTATVVATSPVRALVITDRSFRRLLDDSPQVKTKVMEAMAMRLAPETL